MENLRLAFSSLTFDSNFLTGFSENERFSEFFCDFLSFSEKSMIFQGKISFQSL